MKPRRGKDWALLAVLVLVWGSSFATTKIGVETIPPQWVVALRLSVAALVLVPLARLRGFRLPPPGRIWGWIAALAALGYVIPFWLISWGTQHIDSGLAGILMAMVPLSVIVLAHVLLPDEPLSPLKALGFLIGFAGVVLLLGPAKLVHFAAQGIAFWAQIAILGATLCYACHSMVARRMPHMLPSTLLGACVCLVGAPVMAGYALVTAPHGLAQASTASLAAAVSLGLFPTALATIVLYVLLASAGASFVSMSNYLIPGFAVVLGAAALGERVGLEAILGLCLILSGIAVTEARWRRTRPARR